MASEYFVIFDKGDNWEITGTMVVPDGYETSNEGVWDVSDNKELFDYVKNKLKTYKIQFPKNTDGKLIKEDLIEIPYDNLTLKQQEKITQGRDLLSTRVSIAEILNSVEYMMLSIFFMDKGIFITDKNRSEKYLDVVETGDEDLIDKLERYLEVRDNNIISFAWIENHRNFENKVNSAISDKQLNEIWKDYVQTFE